MLSETTRDSARVHKSEGDTGRTAVLQDRPQRNRTYLQGLGDRLHGAYRRGAPREDCGAL